MDLSIITVTHNAEDYILRQIASVQKASQGIIFEHLIVDNGSRDRTVELIARDFPQIKIITNAENMGFGYANNQAAAMARGNYFLFLNPDMELTPDSLSKLLIWARHRPEVGLASCLLLDNARQINLSALPRRFPRIWDQLLILLKVPHLFPRVLSGYLYTGRDWRREQEVDSVRGSFMLLKREIYDKLGWAFDPRYFIWFEDVDLCREVKNLGYKVVHTPVVTAVDLVGQTFKKKNKIWKQRQLTRSMTQYFRKWEPWYKWGIIWLARPVVIFLVLIFGRFDKKDYL